MLMPFNVTIANLVWSITSLSFAVRGHKTANMWLFLHRLDLQKAGVSAAESSSTAVLSLQTAAKTATTPKRSQRAPQAAFACATSSAPTTCLGQHDVELGLFAQRVDIFPNRAPAPAASRTCSGAPVD
jgi:hypothetical protein